MAIDSEKMVLTIMDASISLDQAGLKTWKAAFGANVTIFDEVSLAADPFEVTLVTEMVEPPEAGAAIGKALKAADETEGTFALALSDFDPDDADFEIPAYYEQELDLTDILADNQDYDEIEGP